MPTFHSKEARFLSLLHGIPTDATLTANLANNYQMSFQMGTGRLGIPCTKIRGGGTRFSPLAVLPLAVSHHRRRFLNRAQNIAQGKPEAKG